MKRLLPMGAVTLACLVAGCARKSDVPESNTRAPVATAPGTAKPLGRPIDPERAGAGSPERVVLEMLRYLQLDLTPLARDFYAKRVITKIGDPLVLSALRTQTASLRVSQVKTIDTERTHRGTLVIMAIKSADAPEVRHSFLMRRAGPRWVIIYDSLLAGALTFEILNRDKVSSGKSRPSAKALAAARRVTARYEGVALEGDPLTVPDD